MPAPYAGRSRSRNTIGCRKRRQNLRGNMAIQREACEEKTISATWGLCASFAVTGRCETLAILTEISILVLGAMLPVDYRNTSISAFLQEAETNGSFQRPGRCLSVAWSLLNVTLAGLPQLWKANEEGTFPQRYGIEIASLANAMLLCGSAMLE
ncbi:hypothetical protein BKA63DRAFT_159782 [Paraphoma chrysanthemicola]|nr:hypothetical protein BKA63DRAFT_159782 [Paraphoma chrysanthemicola]